MKITKKMLNQLINEQVERLTKLKEQQYFYSQKTDTNFYFLDEWEQRQNIKLQKITQYYNEKFPKSPHSSSFKRNKYSNDGIVIVMLDNEGNMVGLLQSWKQDSNTRTLATVQVDSSLRGNSYLRQLFSMLRQRNTQRKIVLHFRQSNYDNLVNKYKAIGFSQLNEVGHYTNGQVKYQMVFKG